MLLPELLLKNIACEQLSQIMSSPAIKMLWTLFSLSFLVFRKSDVSDRKGPRNPGFLEELTSCLLSVKELHK